MSYVAAFVLNSLAEIYFEQIQFLFCFLEGTMCPDYDDGSTPNTDYRSKGYITNTEPSTSKKKKNLIRLLTDASTLSCTHSLSCRSQKPARHGTECSGDTFRRRDET